MLIDSKKIQGYPELDEIDIRLLELLSKNGRMTNAELAAETGIAASTCLGRVRNLVQSGVITGFSAEIAPKALGLELQALISVTLRAGARANLSEFAKETCLVDQDFAKDSKQSVGKVLEAAGLKVNGFVRLRVGA